MDLRRSVRQVITWSSQQIVLTASDGSYRKLLQLQNCPEGGCPSLSDCQQQQRKGTVSTALLISLSLKSINFTLSSIYSIPHLSPYPLFSDCDSFLQSAHQRYLLPEWRLCQPAAQWPRQLRGEMDSFLIILQHIYIYFLTAFTKGENVWQKFVELARQVGEFMTWKQVECPFEEDRAILHYLHTAPIFSEDGARPLYYFHFIASVISDFAY